MTAAAGRLCCSRAAGNNASSVLQEHILAKSEVVPWQIQANVTWGKRLADSCL